MQVIINGKKEEVAADTVLALLTARKVEPRMVSVEVNSTIVHRDQYATTPIQEGDRIELLYYMGGG